MPRSRLDTLIARVAETFRTQAGRYGLDAAAVEARYILNWGGYVNASFFVGDGQRTYHLKLANQPETQADLRRWQSLHALLTARYHAPRLLEWVKIPRTPYAGLLFEYIPGRPADFAAQPEVFSGVLDLLARLHADQELAAALSADEAQTPLCSDAFLSLYIDRFDEDLLVVAGDLPPFVSLDLLSWMMGETRELEGLVRDLDVFQRPAIWPTHGDLWPSNILVTRQGDWFVIDWDDLALGDPALEYGILLGPLWRDGRLSLEEAAALLPAGDPDMRRRFEISLRAFVLDQVIDTLADWVEASFAPDHQETVRAGKEAAHRAALDFYRKMGY